MRAETSPAKSQRTESLGGLASPQLAACAPSGAALPLSSSTISPLPSKKAAARQKTPSSSSIKQWLSPSQGSPGQGGVTRRRALGLAGNSSPANPNPDRRVKRRLETNVPAADGCDAEDDCDGVTELYPEAKKVRTLPALGCPAQENQGHSDCDGESENHPPIKQTGKENLSPGPSDWLSAMGQKMRKGQSTSQSTPRSASKKLEGKTPASTVSMQIWTFDKNQTPFSSSIFFTGPCLGNSVILFLKQQEIKLIMS